MDEQEQGASGCVTRKQLLTGFIEKNDSLFCVEPAKFCPHLDTVEPVPEEGIDTARHCETCGDKSENWVCLACYRVFCSRFVNKHMFEHSSQEGHPLVLSYSDISVWCYQCETYIANEKLTSAIQATCKDKFGD